MRMPRMIVLAVTLGLLLVGCGSGTSAGSGAQASPQPKPADAGTPTATTSPIPTEKPAAPTTGTVVKTADSEFGTMLFDRRGQAIYLFEKERTSTSECYGACAKAWPPVLTDGTPAARGQTREGLLGTTDRTNGKTQVTYAGHPLYYYAHEGPNEVLCHNVIEFGALWKVVQPDGKPAP